MSCLSGLISVVKLIVQFLRENNLNRTLQVLQVLSVYLYSCLSVSSLRLSLYILYLSISFVWLFRCDAISR